MEGTVKWFNSQKAYGFIAGDDGNDYFVHLKAVADGVLIREKDRVSFEAVETDRGKQAQNVTIAPEGSTAPGEAAVEGEPAAEAEESTAEEPEAEAKEEPAAEEPEAEAKGPAKKKPKAKAKEEPAAEEPVPEDSEDF